MSTVKCWPLTVVLMQRVLACQRCARRSEAIKSAAVGDCLSEVHLIQKPLNRIDLRPDVTDRQAVGFKTFRGHRR